jgi:hypothetical protein
MCVWLVCALLAAPASASRSNSLNNNHHHRNNNHNNNKNNNNNNNNNNNRYGHSDNDDHSSSDVVTQYGYGYGDDGYDRYGSLYGDSGSVVTGYRSQDLIETSDWDARGQRRKCIDIPSNLSLCSKVNYTTMMLPNLLQHDTLSEAVQQSKSWVPLVDTHCHPDTQVFLCSLFAPVCLEVPIPDREIYPCRYLCETVKEHCLPRMKSYGYDWPDMLRCDRFPDQNDMCIGLVHGKLGQSISLSYNNFYLYFVFCNDSVTGIQFTVQFWLLFPGRARQRRSRAYPGHGETTHPNPIPILQTALN